MCLRKPKEFKNDVPVNNFSLSEGFRSVRCGGRLLEMVTQFIAKSKSGAVRFGADSDGTFSQQIIYRRFLEGNLWKFKISVTGFKFLNFLNDSLRSIEILFFSLDKHTFAFPSKAQFQKPQPITKWHVARLIRVRRHAIAPVARPDSPFFSSVALRLHSQKWGT